MILTIGISAGTHQIHQIDDLWASLRPLADVVEFLVDIVDTGSGEADYVKKLSQAATGLKISRVRIRKHGHLGESRNWVIDHATARCVFFIDGDDFIDSTKMRYILDALQNAPSLPHLVMFSGYKYTDGQTREWLNNALPRAEETCDPSALKRWFRDKGWGCTTACLKIYSLNWLRRLKIRFPSGLFYEDTPFWFDIINSVDKTTQIRVFNVGVYFYRQGHSSQQISQTRDRRLFHIFWILEDIKERLRRGAAYEDLWIAYHAFAIDHLRWSLHCITAQANATDAEISLFRLLVDREYRDSRSYLVERQMFSLPFRVHREFLFRQYPLTLMRWQGSIERRAGKIGRLFFKGA